MDLTQGPIRVMLRYSTHLRGILGTLICPCTCLVGKLVTSRNVDRMVNSSGDLSLLVLLGSLDSKRVVVLPLAGPLLIKVQREVSWAGSLSECRLTH